MEEILFDEILCEIFTRLPSSSSSSSSISSSLPSFESVPLVSKRWLRLYRASKTSMSLKFSPHDTSVITLLPSILNNHPSLSSLSISRGFTINTKIITTPIRSDVESLKAETIFNDELISIISSCCFNLRSLSFLINPVSSSSLVPLSTSSSLTSLSIEVWKPQNSGFTWIALFSSLKELSIHVCSTSSPAFDFYPKSKPNPEVVELGLESISLFGIEPDDNDVTWLWKCCRKLKRLSLRSCGSIGEIEFFGLCLENLEEIELRTCRSIVDVVLLKVSEICESLKSLLIHDGGSKDGLVCFMNNARCYDTLERLDLRLPMDLTDDHLVSLAANFKSLSSISLTSCIFVTGFSLKALALSFSSSLEELSLLSCNAIERERGLLATIGQHLGRLRKLDLTRNEWLFDKEVVSMLASCNGLVEVVLRECKHLTGAVLVALNKNCVKLKTLDILSCRLIEPDDVEGFVMKTQCLKKLVVEENQITEAIVKLASSKLIETVVFPSLVW
ncbi:Leucine-rich repeat cysteine-containing subtype [Arabidopsis suecica]|uniref:Leucine-rich repeat cysteine-containing subtype n=1 Tax=Arabidopsis suecica TaxID=45249 RepID=A0A8T1YRR4_ARASU|nr:Leucine-rich repeat cysteine-containing subtype [Arabidopsis suecica]